MKAISIALRIILLVCFVFISTSTYGTEESATTTMKAFAPPPIASITGIVTAKTDPRAALPDVTLTTADGKIFKIVANKNGIKLGTELNGKTAEVNPEIVVITFKKFIAPEKPSALSAEPVKEAETSAVKIEKQAKSVKDVVWNGFVAVAKDEKGKINAISFATDDKKVWQIIVDETSTKMANELDGQKAEIIFALSIKAFKAVDTENFEKEIKTEIKVIEKEPKDK
jgi:hypothetical protein